MMSLFSNSTVPATTLHSGGIEAHSGNLVNIERKVRAYRPRLLRINVKVISTFGE